MKHGPVRASAVIAFAILGGACGKKSGEPPAATGSGAGPVTHDGAGGSVPPPRAAGSDVPAPAAHPAKIDDQALDAAIAAKGFQPAAVRQRAIGPHSAWAVVEAPRNADHKVVELDLIRVRADGAAVLALTPAARKNPTWWDSDVEPIEVRDLDGDGSDECLVVLTWLQDIPGTGTGESAKQLHVITDGAPPKVAYAAIVDYATQSQQLTDHDKKDPPAPEHIGYDWKVAGSPPVLALRRTENQLNPKRAAGLTDPASEPLLAAGEGKDIPLSLR